MKRSLLLILLLKSFIYGDGIACPSCIKFKNLSIAEQDKIIKKDFKVMHELFKKLEVTIESIDNTRTEIKKLKKNINTRNEFCFALSLMKNDLNILNEDLSKISNKENKKYQVANKIYLEQKYIFNEKKSECEGL